MNQSDAPLTRDVIIAQVRRLNERVTDAVVLTCVVVTSDLFESATA